MQLVLIIEDPAQILLPFPGVTVVAAPPTTLQLVPAVVDARYRAWSYEPQRDELVWSGDDAEEAA